MRDRPWTWKVVGNGEACTFNSGNFYFFRLGLTLEHTFSNLIHPLQESFQINENVPFPIPISNCLFAMVEFLQSLLVRRIMLAECPYFLGLAK